MSSMGKRAFLIPILLALTASASAVLPSIAFPDSGVASAATASINASIAEWRQFRQGGNYSFSDYARFLNYNHGWPGESAMRRDAEKAMRAGENASLVLGFYAQEKPQSGSGWTRYSDALSSVGRSSEAIDAARHAWASDDLSSADEAYILGRFGANLTAADHDARVDALLFNKDPADAARLLAWTSPDRRSAFAARIAMQQRSPDAEILFRSASHRISADSGLLMDRLRYLRDGGNETMARQLAGQPHHFTEKPADPERWYEMLLLLANGAVDDRQWNSAYNIARQLDDALPAGAQVSDQPYGVRDDYTSLAWLAGRVALDRLHNPGNAIAMFYRYAYGGKSLQVATKGFYWAGRASLAAGRPADASAYFQRAAAYPDLFYGQLALERLGRSVPAPAYPLGVTAADPQRTAFNSNRLVQATRTMAYYASEPERMKFVRALAESLKNDKNRALALEMARQLHRRDLAVWVTRAARNDGDPFYVRDAYPTLTATPRTSWALANGITRQ